MLNAQATNSSHFFQNFNVILFGGKNWSFWLSKHANSLLCIVDGKLCWMFGLSLDRSWEKTLTGIGMHILEFKVRKWRRKNLLSFWRKCAFESSLIESTWWKKAFFAQDFSCFKLAIQLLLHYGLKQLLDFAYVLHRSLVRGRPGCAAGGMSRFFAALNLDMDLIFLHSSWGIKRQWLWGLVELGSLVW